MIGEAEGAARGNPAPTIAIMAMLIATASSNGVGPKLGPPICSPGLCPYEEVATALLSRPDCPPVFRGRVGNGGRFEQRGGIFASAVSVTTGVNTEAFAARRAC
jgi:hypothetical protein